MCAGGKNRRISFPSCCSIFLEEYVLDHGIQSDANVSAQLHESRHLGSNLLQKSQFSQKATYRACGDEQKQVAESGRCLRGTESLCEVSIERILHGLAGHRQELGAAFIEFRSVRVQSHDGFEGDELGFSDGESSELCDHLIEHVPLHASANGGLCTRCGSILVLAAICVCLCRERHLGLSPFSSWLAD